jgi:Flp pilus assembly pilin Flp
MSEDASMIDLLKHLARDESGQDLAEYGIALSVIAIGVVVAAGSIADFVDQLWEDPENTLQTTAAAN